MTVYLKKNGVWKENRFTYLKRNDKFGNCCRVYIKTNGEWKLAENVVYSRVTANSRYTVWNSRDNITDTSVNNICANYETIDTYKLIGKNLSNWLGNLFAGVNGTGHKIKNINLSSFDTSNIEYMDSMFEGCNELENVNLSNLDTSKVKRLDAMFAGCSSITNLDLRSFDTRLATDMSGMFAGCTNLTSILVGSNWSTVNADTTNMFDGCGTDHVTVVN